jgi:protein-tyrosine phosphatase
LHLSLTTILWAKYSEHLRGARLFFLRCWLILCGLSILTTYQHHFIDLPTGIWVGLFCLSLFPERQAVRLAPERQSASLVLGSLYLAGCVGLTTTACWLGGLAWLLLWPAGSMLVVAIAYVTGSPQLLWQRDRATGWASRILLAPYLGAAWLNSRWWTRSEPPAQEIVPGLWLGRVPARRERERLRIASVVHLAPELPLHAGDIACRGVPMLDLTVPEAGQLEEAVNAIEDLKTSRPTLVCCALGYSRSAMATAAWLVASRKAPTVDSAIAMLRARRRRVVLSAAHRARLEEWALIRRN